MTWKSDPAFYCSVWLLEWLQASGCLRSQALGCWQRWKEVAFGEPWLVVGIVSADFSNVGLCLFPATDHKAFSALHCWSLHRSYCLCDGEGCRHSGSFSMLFQQRAERELQCGRRLVPRLRCWSVRGSRGDASRARLSVRRDRIEPPRWGRIVKGRLVAQLQRIDLSEKSVCLFLNFIFPASHKLLFWISS